MNLFLLFLIACLVGGLMLPRVPLRRMMLPLAAGCVLIAVGYFFFGKI
jgi:hypothetical protein